MKFLSMFLCFMLCFPMAFAEEPLHIIASNFPAFDFARTIAGVHADISMLLPAGTESHSYEPTPQDIIAIQNCDLFVYTGGESDTWIDAMLASMAESAPNTFALSECVDLLAAEASESMEHHHSQSRDGKCTIPEHVHTDDEHHHEMDEHVWTSPKNVMIIAAELNDSLCRLRPQHADKFNLNTQQFLSELQKLDSAFESIIATGKQDLIVFGDRFPFRYFAADYNLRYDAAFPGCSEDSEPSVRTVISLIDTIREKKIPVVFHIEFSSKRTASILAEETGAKMLLFHSCHNVSAEEIESGATYLSLMWQNTESLKEALN